jgi:MFS family permease
MGGLVADRYGWRAAFLVAAAPGLVLAAVIALTVKDPRGRPVRNTVPLGRSIAAGLRDFGATVVALSRKPTFWFAAVGAGFSAFVGYAHLFFNASFFLRCHSAELTALAGHFGLKPIGLLGPILGVASGVGGLIGSLLGGHITDRASTGDRRLSMSVPAIAALVAIPAIAAIYTLPSVLPALALLLVPNIAATFWYGAVYSTAQSVVEPRRRATAAALLLLILNLIGLGFGPPFLSAVSDFLAKSQHLGEAEGLRWAMIAAGSFSVLAAAFFWLARRWVREDVVS